MYSPIFAWNDYFTGTPATTLNSSQYTSNQTFSVSSVYVLSCLFNKCTIASGNGGALYLSTSVTYFFVEFSSFFSCKTNSGQGGAIYLYNSNCLQSVLYAVCCNDCTSTDIGPFARISINNVASNKNYVNYTSLMYCLCDSTGSRETICLESGKVDCPSFNISMNKCSYQSGFFCSPFKDTSSATSSFIYSTFTDNKATDSMCLYCSGAAKHEIKCCNILRNTQVTLSSYGIIWTNGNVMIEDSCILENTANYIFYSHTSTSIITLSNCTVDIISHYNSFTMQNTITKSFIHGLNHMSTQNCHSEYDSAGTLTAIPYVSQSTKKVFCYTREICHCQVRISESFPLICLFIITFIHPNPSKD
jgi:hypothetical protein